MKTLKLVPEYEQKLIELKIKDKFMDNLKADCLSTKEPLNDAIKYLNEQISFTLFLAAGFLWDKSPEGQEFWIEISKK